MSLQPPPPAFPTALRVFGIINVILAIIKIASLYSSYQLYLGTPPANMQYMRDLLEQDSAFGLTMRILAICTALYAVVQLVGGINLFRGREWARRLVIYSSWYAIVATLVNGYMSATRIMPAAAREALTRMRHELDATTQSVMSALPTAVTIVTVVLGIAFLVTQIILLTRPHIRVFCENQSAQPPTPAA